VLWALVRDPERRAAIVSYSQGLAEASGRLIRNLITSHDGTDGSLDLGLRIARDNGAASRWQLEGHRGGLITAGVGSGLTGRAVDLLVLDDPYADREQAESAWYRGRVQEWWQSVGSTRLAPGAPACVVLTRWHHDDIAARLTAGEDGHRWRTVNIPALADHDPRKGQSDPLGREPGQWLKSARGRTAAQWEEIRIQAGSRTFTSLYQGRPSPDTGDVWKRSWWRRYREPLWSQHPAVPGAYVVRECDEMVISWGMAFKGEDAKVSDYVVGQVWARRGADVFLLDQVHKRLGFTETVTAFTAMAGRWPQCHRHLVESAANGVAIIDLLRSRIGGIVAVKPTESKYSRASAVAPFLEAGNVFLPDREVALFDPEGLIDEASAFPSGAHDDLVDATSQALAAMLLDRNGFGAWLGWIKRQGEKRAAEELAAAEGKRALPAAPSGAGGRNGRVTTGRSH
jgi:predicted phage terminase large subunit-like protein